ncbi:amino acid permease [Brevundimonas aurantiaca]|jgi:APA family basic amino acid/polyamine antiporter|uniref:amino acid permease n=1 Tax=Brevundimonas aurantiaca TaxID=74316 RepID=UPI001D191709|nr:amino acid permease [Brevundimonas aurantiaca]MCC4293815.1 amino acid permease [Brevundimonas aurantiaca]
MAFWNRRRSIDVMTAPHDGPRLKPTLSWPHLLALGVGAIVGTGILTLIGVGAGLAGPAVLISFGLAGLVCVCAALAYAELSTMMPTAGSAYTYSYAVLGEMIAWVVGWSLILEYSLVVSAVAVGWSGYAVGFLNGLGVDLPTVLTAGPHAGGIINLPAVAIIGVVTGLLLLGTKESATLNAVLVVIKIAALVVFVAIALPAFKPENFTPFMPNGFGAPFVQTGVMAAAAIIFFAFYGFDAISTAAEETKKPERDLAIGIIGSMLVCTALYLVVAAAAIGARPVSDFADSPEPLALILRQMGQGTAAQWIAAAAVIALPTVLLAFLFGQSRIFLGMARDGLLPRRLAKVSARGVPAVVTVFTAVVVAILAGLLPLDELASLANAGTLAAFCAVGVCLIVLRIREPGRRRVFKAPLWPLVGAVTVIGCVVFFLSLKPVTQIGFVVWNGIGVLIYLAWSSRNSRLAKGEEEAA